MYGSDVGCHSSSIALSEGDADAVYEMLALLGYSQSAMLCMHVMLHAAMLCAERGTAQSEGAICRAVYSSNEGDAVYVMQM